MSFKSCNPCSLVEKSDMYYLKYKILYTSDGTLHKDIYPSSVLYTKLFNRTLCVLITVYFTCNT